MIHWAWILPTVFVGFWLGYLTAAMMSCASDADDIAELMLEKWHDPD